VIYPRFSCCFGIYCALFERWRGIDSVVDSIYDFEYKTDHPRNLMLHLEVILGACTETQLSTSSSWGRPKLKLDALTTSPPEKYLEPHQPPMSLYYEAASVLANTSNAGGSLKSRIYNNKDLKSTPAQLFALISEASKWSVVVKNVVERCGVLAEERKVRK